MRLRALIAVTLALLGLAACGVDDASQPITMDGGARDASCAPRLSGAWVPSWRPPRTMLFACSDAQVQTEFDLCENESTYSAGACAAWSRDVANAACRRCLYTTEDEASYGPFVYLRNRILRINVPGCIALADGNLGASGCGAQFHAFQACGDAACMTACAAFDGFTACVAEAEDGVCSPYRLDSACGERATYAACLDFGTFADYYRGVAKIFCGAGFVADAGASEARRGDAGPARQIEARPRFGAGEAIGR
jgi:hypothetical protein